MPQSAEAIAASPALEARRARAREAGVPRILIADADPYLAFLVRLTLPGAHVVDTPPLDDPQALREAAPHLAIVDATSPAVPGLMQIPGARILGLVDAVRADGAPKPPPLDGLLARPFLPAEFSRAVRRTLGVEEARSAERAGGRYARALSGLRAASVAAAALLAVGAEGIGGPTAGLIGAALAYSAIRARRAPSTSWAVADIATAAVLVALGGGMGSPFVLFAVVSVASAGVASGAGLGVAGGAIVAASSSLDMVARARAGDLDPAHTATWLGLFLLAGAGGGFAKRIWPALRRDGARELAEANRVLSSLYRIARTMPGGFEVGTVAAAVLDEVRDTLGSQAGVVLVGGGAMNVAGSYGIAEPRSLSIDGASEIVTLIAGQSAAVFGRDDVGRGVALALGETECWIAASVRRDAAPLGLLLAACPDHRRHHQLRALLRELADEAAVAVENAYIFARVRDLSVDGERRRLAREIHDGIAQSLTHLRLELDFIARHGEAEAIRGDIGHLSGVVDRAAGDVRAMILGLRSGVGDEGLAGALRSYFADLRSLGGPAVAFSATGAGRLPFHTESEIFRFVQDCVARMTRGARAGDVRILMRSEGDDAHIRIESAAGALGAGGEVDAEMVRRAREAGIAVNESRRPGGGSMVDIRPLTGPSTVMRSEKRVERSMA